MSNELHELRIHISRIRDAANWNMRLSTQLLTLVEKYAMLMGDCSAEGNENYEDLRKGLGGVPVQMQLLEEYEDLWRL